MKLIHIHTDLKFIGQTKYFEGNNFENLSIIIADPDNCRGPHRENTLFFTHTPKSVHKIIEISSDADLVILYDLNFIKCKIALGLPENIKIAWRFFGYELYQKESQFYTSELTQRAGTLKKTQFIIKSLLNILSSLRFHLKWGFSSKSCFTSAVNRINFFLCHSKEEYDLLIASWPYLPVYVRLPVLPYYAGISEFGTKEPFIILGNNRSAYNNHLDIIKIIDESANKTKYQFMLLFNYGTESNYSREVRKAVNNKNYYKLVDDFMPLEELNMLYQKASAAIFNGYRQMALGNIFLSLRNGIKIYLNNKNIVMQWLSNEGFKIFSVDDLAEDLENEKISLTDNEAKYNVEQLQKLIKSYSIDDFQKVIYSLILETRK